MKFFLYTPTFNRGKLWNLLYEEPVPGIRSSYEHLYELIQSAKNGTFDVDQTDFNRRAYEATSKTNARINSFKNVKKELLIVSDSSTNGDGSFSVGYGDVREGTALSDYEAAFDDVLSSETLRVGIEAIDSIQHETLRSTGGIDVLHSLKNGLLGSDDAEAALVSACAADANVRDMVVDLLTSSTQTGDENDSLANQIAEYLKKKAE